MKTDKLLIEIYMEEIPPFELYKLTDYFKNKLKDFLKENNINYSNAKFFSTPRRVSCILEDIPEAQEDVSIKVFGPYKNVAFDKNNEPTRALQGFLKSKNKKVSDLFYLKDKKGEKIYFKEEQKGKKLREILKEFLELLIAKAPFKKSMKWGENTYRFIRPIHNIMVIFANEVLDLEVKNLKSNNKTKGHYILFPNYFELKDINSYEKLLKEKNVIIDENKRKEIIIKQMENLEKDKGFYIKKDDVLLKETVNILENPNIFLGEFSKEYLELPDEVLITSMKKHQKYFPVYDKNENLLNYFIGFSNINVTDDIIRGNQRVLKARLSDAMFFYKEDLKKGLDILYPKLDTVLFQKKLGSYKDKIKRVKKIAKSLNKLLNFNIDDAKVEKASEMLKVDLLTGIVSEFPNLEGIAGYYYALKLNLDKDIALSIKEHYLPKTANDELPSENLSILLSISDKMDTLLGGFYAGLAPTGSKDAFALRRTALGIIRILISKNYEISIDELLELSMNVLIGKEDIKLKNVLTDFIKDRLKFYLKINYSHDIVEAVTKENSIINNKIIFLCDTLKTFKTKEVSNNLISLLKRIKNILKKDLNITGEIDNGLLIKNEEKNIYNWICKNRSELKKLNDSANFNDFLNLSISIYDDLDEFFNNVMVNDKDEGIKNNRKLLLAELYRLVNSIASLDRLVS